MPLAKAIQTPPAIGANVALNVALNAAPSVSIAAPKDAQTGSIARQNGARNELKAAVTAPQTAPIAAEGPAQAIGSNAAANGGRTEWNAEANVGQIRPSAAVTAVPIA